MTSTALPLAPPPLHIIRSHSSAISTLFISGDNERIYSGDISGLVVITSTRSLRPLASWKAHTDGLLGVEEWGKHVITHGRDNKLHVWKLPSHTPSALGGSASAPDATALELDYSLDVNALNFCRFSLLPLDDVVSLPLTSPPRALVAIPNLVESSLADIWTLPAMERMHAAVGRGKLDDPTEILGSDGRGVKNPTGIIMSMHLLPASGGATRLADRAISLLTSYENGSVKLWRYCKIEKERSIEGVGWECVWSFKLHVESVMATIVSLDRSIALSVSADHLVGRYDLHADPIANLESAGTLYRTKHPGNGAVAIHGDGRVCAVGGWDGRVRLHSTKSLKALGTLIYHKAAVQSLAFAHARPVPVRRRRRHQHHHSHGIPNVTSGGGGGGSSITEDGASDTKVSAETSDPPPSGNDDAGRGDDADGPDDGADDDDVADDSGADNGDGDDDDDEDDADSEDEEGGGGGGEEGVDDDDMMTAEERARRSRWLVSGGKDGRVAVWALKDFITRGQDDGQSSSSGATRVAVPRKKN